MTGKTYPKNFERYWASCKSREMKIYDGFDGADLKKILFNAYRAGVRHTNGEHSRARSRYWARKRKRSWV